MLESGLKVWVLVCWQADGALLVVDLLAGTPLEDKHAWEKLVPPLPDLGVGVL